MEISKGSQIAVAISTELMIKDLETDEPIKQALRYVFTIIGLRGKNIPSGLEKDVLMNFITENYRTYAPSEIRIAFELAIKSEIEVDLTHYQHFSVIYLTEVMKAYFEHRKRVTKLMQEEIEAEERENRKASPEQIEANYREFDIEWILKPYMRFKKDGVIDFGITPIEYIFNSLQDRHGLIDLNAKEKIDLYNEQKDILEKQWGEEVKKKALTKKENSLKKDLLEIIGGINPKGKKKRIQSACRYEMVFRFFVHCKENNTELSKILKIK